VYDCMCMWYSTEMEKCKADDVQMQVQGTNESVYVQFDNVLLSVEMEK